MKVAVDSEILGPVISLEKDINICRIVQISEANEGKIRAHNAVSIDVQAISVVKFVSTQMVLYQTGRFLVKDFDFLLLPSR